jgi:hypothetical protein
MIPDMPDPIALLTLDDDFNTEYGMLQPEQTVIVRAYSEDSDDAVLSEIQPRYVIMYEPNLDFVRRLEVCTLVLFSYGPLTPWCPGVQKEYAWLGCQGIPHAVQQQL